MRAVDKARSSLPPGEMSALVPMFINAQTGRFAPGATITLGARGDSYYEYLLKQWLLTGKTDPFYLDLYNEVCICVSVCLSVTVCICVSVCLSPCVYVCDLMPSAPPSPPRY